MSYLPAQVKISWRKPYEVDDIISIEVYRYRKELTRCEDYIEFGVKIHETEIIEDGECTDDIASPSSWSYAVFCKNEVSMAPCVTKVHIVYPDKDIDGIEDSIDPYLNDTDNDGIENKCDADFPRNRFKKDTDGDGVIDDCDPDDDNDGILDENDAFPWDKNKKLKIIIGDSIFENEYPEGARVGLMAAPNLTDGEQFIKWIGEVDNPEELITSVEMHRDQDVLAHFGIMYNDLTLGQRTEDDTNSVRFGVMEGGGQKIYAKRVGIIATANEGFQFKEWRVETTGVQLGDIYNPSTSFIMPNNDVRIDAVFEKDPCYGFTVILSKIHNTDFTNFNGEIEATPVGGSGPYVYEWIGKSSSGSKITGLSAGVYGVKVTDVNGCIVVDNTPIEDLSVDPCSGFSINVLNVQHNTEWEEDKHDGSILVAPAGGQGPYTYSWSGGTGHDTGPFAGKTDRLDADGNNVDPFGLSPGEYVVTVTDSRGCVAKKQITVEQQALDPCRDFNGITHIAGNNTSTVGSNPFQNEPLVWLNWWKGLYTPNEVAWWDSYDKDDHTSPWGFVNLLDRLLELGFLDGEGVIQSINSQQTLELLNMLKGITKTYAVYDSSGNVVEDTYWSSDWNAWVSPWAGKPVEEKFSISVLFGNDRIPSSDILRSSQPHIFKIPSPGTRHPVVFIKGTKDLPSEINENTTYYAEAFGTGSELFKIYNDKTSNNAISFTRNVDILNPSNNEDLGPHYCQTAVLYTNFKKSRSIVDATFIWSLVRSHGINRHGGYGNGINFARYHTGSGFVYTGTWFHPVSDMVDSLKEYGRSHFLESAMLEVVMRPAIALNKFNGSVAINFDGGATPLQTDALLANDDYRIDANGDLQPNKTVFLGSTTAYKTGKGTWSQLPPGKYSYAATDNNGCQKSIGDIIIN